MRFWVSQPRGSQLTVSKSGPAAQDAVARVRLITRVAMQLRARRRVEITGFSLPQSDMRLAQLQYRRRGPADRVSAPTDRLGQASSRMRMDAPPSSCFPQGCREVGVTPRAKTGAGLHAAGGLIWRPSPRGDRRDQVTAGRRASVIDLRAWSLTASDAMQLVE